ncbi:uncharacterized protein LOC113470724 [Diaphorina citri]|uniref:Uncharacterized protein LOC113470724 n=1 Tax=Diaphorina citri TaxID=121845 RepID=A0A3Q0J9L5_DIACI|nr:uncharacterized protein LOC113470724 [Diaphorina citri]XP_026685187.1 uncharacterized protein LOC113470724 [Diaphorina citri]XP_026685188.1 uncharacterized protein LOC113470724 [Diaphorina citri]KAI5729626.1 hypothetical protein M8J76_004709 [Diaphorina citri]KAI5734549.1 hypothetical protein M8J77_007815 [Diaphorina citri]
MAKCVWSNGSTTSHLPQFQLKKVLIPWAPAHDGQRRTDRTSEFTHGAHKENMGGVDFLDRMMSYYRISHRTKKWTVRTIVHMIDFAVAAGWIMYRRDMIAQNTPRNRIMDLLDFKLSIKNHLIHVDPPAEDSDSDFEDNPQPAKT